MKHRITPFLALALLYVTATAQGEWKWAHYWTGQDGSYDAYYNYITKTAFDNEGNLYVYGAMGNNPVYDGEPFEYCTEAMAGGANNPSILLTKFDTLGNMLWSKVVRSQTEAAVPHWLEVKDDRICISGSSSFFGSGSGAWLYFLDTLITKAQIDALPAEQRKPPFKAYSRWTFFADFDFDGNLLDCHFVETFTREKLLQGTDSVQLAYSLCPGIRDAPTHWDREGNTYFFTPFQYGGAEENPFTLVVDGDTNRTYNLFLPGSTDEYKSIYNAMLYKFTPDWRLDFGHLLVDHTDGIATPYELTQDSVNPIFYCYLTGLSFDEEDNMYLSGYIQLALCTEAYGVNLHNYPVHIWWDDSHSLTIDDKSSAPQANFIINYNPDGQVVWSNQVYTMLHAQTSYAIAYLYQNQVYENYLIVCGDAENNDSSSIYFDMDLGNSVDRFSSSQELRAYIALFNKDNGMFVLSSIVPDPSSSNFVFGRAAPAAINNQIVAFSRKASQIGLARWGVDGNFLSFDPCLSRPQTMLGSGVTAVDENGNVLVTINMKGNISFTEDVIVQGSTSNSNAVFGVYHDPELLVPYVKVPEYEKHIVSLHLYPNPASDFIFVDCGELQPEAIFVFDENGRQLRRIGCDNDIMAVSLVGFPAGTYLLKAVSSDGTTAVGRFVKAD